MSAVRNPARPPSMTAAKKFNDGIRSELTRFDPTTVERFVRAVGIALGMNDWAYDSGEATRLDELKKLKRAAEVFLGDTDEPVSATPFPRIDDVLGRHATTDHSFDNARQFYRARALARAGVTEWLRQIDGAIATAPPRRKPPADSTGLLARLADAYEELLGEEPKSTPGGTYSNIAVRVLGHVRGRAPQSVRRQVNAALRMHRSRTIR